MTQMQIGSVIRKYRKECGLTQEEMAKRLGVTTPAVNKWENGNTNPDIELLAPIARLLHISLDTLLSFQEKLTDMEIETLIRQMGDKLEKEGYPLSLKVGFKRRNKQTFAKTTRTTQEIVTSICLGIFSKCSYLCLIS